jgi:hypothetical protein
MALRHRSRITIVTCALCLLVSMALTRVASAGVYPMYQCRAVGGHPAPVSAAWRVDPRPNGYGYNSCSSGGSFGIVQAPSGQTGNNGGSALVVTVPQSRANVSIDRAVFGLVISPKTGDGYSHGAVSVWSPGEELDTQLLPDFNTGWIDRATGPFTGSHSPTGPMGSDLPNGAREVAVTTNCFSSCTFNPPESVQIHQAVLTLREDAAPAAGAFAGTLLTGTPRAGRQTLRYDASDADSGVRTVTALVDDAPAATDDLGGSCDYVDFNACPTSVRGRELAFDVSRFGLGEHRLAVVVQDAAGNAITQELGSFVVGTAPGSVERGALNGRNATDVAKLTARIGRRRSTTTDYGRRVVVRGRLVNDAGLPIIGARVDVLRQTLLRGAATRTFDQARTGSDGRYRASLPAYMPSSRLRLAYRSHLNDAVEAAHATVTLRVRARVILRVVRHTVAPFGVIRLRGRLVGAPLPARGKVIELRARAKSTRTWLPFRSVRTDRRGRFRTDYRLRQGYRNVTYEFEALARADGGYPYATGRSAPQRVRVG